MLHDNQPSDASQSHAHTSPPPQTAAKPVPKKQKQKPVAVLTILFQTYLSFLSHPKILSIGIKH